MDILIIALLTMIYSRARRLLFGTRNGRFVVVLPAVRGAD